MNGNNTGKNNLAVVPRIVATRRLGKDLRNPRAKICVTLENPAAAEELLMSSRVLRSSKNEDVRKIFMNRDLTKQQAELNYKKRCERRKVTDGHPPAPAGLSGEGQLFRK